MAPALMINTITNPPPCSWDKQSTVVSVSCQGRRAAQSPRWNHIPAHVEIAGMYLVLIHLATVEKNPGPTYSDIQRAKRQLARVKKQVEKAKINRQVRADQKRAARTREDLAEEGVEPNPGPHKKGDNGNKTYAEAVTGSVDKGKEKEPATASTSEPYVVAEDKSGALAAHEKNNAPKVKKYKKGQNPSRGKGWSGASPEAMVMRGCGAAKVQEAVEREGYLVKVEALRTKWPAAHRNFIHDVCWDDSMYKEVMACDKENWDEVALDLMGEEMSLKRYRIGYVPPVVPVAEEVGPKIPVSGVYFGSQQWSEVLLRRSWRRWLLVAAALLALCMLPSPGSVDQTWKSAQAYIGENYPAALEWLGDKQYRVKYNANYCLDKWYQSTANWDPARARQARWYYRNTKRLVAGYESWDDYLLKRNETFESRFGFRPIKIIMFRDGVKEWFYSGSLAATAVRWSCYVVYWVVVGLANVVYVLVHIPVWLYQGACIIFNYHYYILIWEDPMILVDLVVGTEDFTPLVRQLEFNLPEMGYVSWVLSFATVWWVELGFLLFRLSAIAVVSAYLGGDMWNVVSAEVRRIVVDVAGDNRLRTNAHVSLLPRPVFVHQYSEGWELTFRNYLPWYKKRFLRFVVDHWVAVALSEYGEGADVEIFLSNVHQKFLRCAELGIPDVDYARYKADTTDFLRLLLTPGFHLPPSRRTSAVGEPEYVL